MRTYRDLEVWQASRELVLAVYALTKLFPKEELFGLTSQMRRAAVSIPANLAEGAARHGRKEFLQFVRVARGSLAELETYLDLAPDLCLCTAEEAEPIRHVSERVAQMLTRLALSLERSSKSPSPERTQEL